MQVQTWEFLVGHSGLGLLKLENDRKVLLKDNSALRESLRRSKEKELSHLTESEFKAEVAKGGSFRYSKLTFSLKANINL